MNSVEKTCTCTGLHVGPQYIACPTDLDILSDRAALKKKGIKLLAKPLGRLSAVPNHVRPGERNPVEGKFGQAKTAYGLDCIRARLQDTSESWIASIILVLNLVKSAGGALLCLIDEWATSFSASALLKPLNVFQQILFKIETDL